MRRNRGQPIKLTVLKSRLPDGQVYAPLVPILKSLKLNVPQLNKSGEELAASSVQQVGSEQVTSKKGEFVVKFCGSVRLGKNGDIAQLSLGIEKARGSGESVEVPVRVTVGQTLVTVVEVSSGKVNREDVIC
jgi:hypothetical protein